MDLASSSGFEARCPQQPTSGDSRPPKATLADDIAIVQKTAAELKAAGHPIIVLAHSFGGGVASNAITPDLYAAEPRNASTPGVIRIVWLTTHLPLPGGTVSEIFDRHGFLCDVDLQVNEDGTASVKNAVEAFYNDMPQSVAELHAAQNVTHNFVALVQEKTTHAPWKDIPSTFVYCDHDLAIKKPLQEAMIKDAEAEGGHFETVTLDAAHNPFLSAPNDVLNVLQKVWEGAK